jgi:spore coat protein CotH
MNHCKRLVCRVVLPAGFAAALLLAAQTGSDAQPPPDKKDFGKKGPKGPGGPPGFGEPRRLLVKQFDKDGDGRLNAEERLAARAFLKEQPARGPGGPKGRWRGTPGPRVSPQEVRTYPADVPLYDTTVLRTIFLEFDNPDWEAELEDFYHTDVEVPATVTVDGKRYPNVGVHFRGNSSFHRLSAGQKRSLNLAFHFVDSKQRLYGYRTLNLLNSHEDPTFMHSVLYCNVARQYLPAPKANYVKVVINGESWGIYVNQQQFNKDFLRDNYKTTGGARWKVPGGPGFGSGGLVYLGENSRDYKRHYQIKSKDEERAWQALIALCRTLNRTPPEQLEAALRPVLDIDGVLWFLALDNAVINDDGYWTRAGDYSLYLDEQGKFHLSPHDTNETFQPIHSGPGGPRGGPGFGKGPGNGPGAGGYALDPLIGLNNARTPLRSRLLAVPSLRAKYLANLRTIAEESFAWPKLKPLVDQYRALIEREVELDTRKLYSLAEFKASVADVPPAEGRGSRYNLRAFAEGRRAYLLNHPEIRKASVP